MPTYVNAHDLSNGSLSNYTGQRPTISGAGPLGDGLGNQLATDSDDSVTLQELNLGIWVYIERAIKNGLPIILVV